MWRDEPNPDSIKCGNCGSVYVEEYAAYMNEYNIARECYICQQCGAYSTDAETWFEESEEWF